MSWINLLRNLASVLLLVLALLTAALETFHPVGIEAIRTWNQPRQWLGSQFGYNQRWSMFTGTPSANDRLEQDTKIVFSLLRPLGRDRSGHLIDPGTRLPVRREQLLTGAMEQTSGMRTAASVIWTYRNNAEHPANRFWTQRVAEQAARDLTQAGWDIVGIEFVRVEYATSLEGKLPADWPEGARVKVTPWAAVAIADGSPGPLNLLP